MSEKTRLNPIQLVFFSNMDIVMGHIPQYGVYTSLLGIYLIMGYIPHYGAHT